ncbi:MAG TPA: cytochrome c biogenesis protein CcdA [Gaiellaceae bacterium]
MLASTASQLPVAFAVGFVSIVLPCVLPLVPGYLSAVSAIEAGRLGEPGVGRRVAVASLPFIVGFTTVFVVLGAGVAAIGSALNARTKNELAGFLLIVIGLGFIGLLPWPERPVAPGLPARVRGSSILLGAAFAVCAAPCIGAVLGSILTLAAKSGTVASGVVLLAAYSLGLGAAFVLAAIAFTKAMGAFRWVRDQYRVIQIVGGVTLVALGLLLFFDRSWWLNVAVNRVLESVGLDRI